MKCSVIITAYNQYDSLQMVLRNFARQTMPNGEFEVIIVDDGSTDELAYIDKREVHNLCPNAKLLHFENGGRAVSRNRGIQAASSDQLIFCDGDRFPSDTFVEEHYNSLSIYGVNIGLPYDYFGGRIFNWDRKDELCSRFGRLPRYYRKIQSMYSHGQSNSKLRWMSLLIGNSSIRRDIVEKAGLFDCAYAGWGFEHFELAWRIQHVMDVTFGMCNAASFHIPHKREDKFYLNRIQDGIQQICLTHPEINSNMMFDMLCSDKSVDEIEEEYYNEVF